MKYKVVKYTGKNGGKMATIREIYDDYDGNIIQFYETPSLTSYYDLKMQGSEIFDTEEEAENYIKEYMGAENVLVHKKRKAQEDITEELKKMKDDLVDMEFACAVMSRKINDLINERTRKGNVPTKLDRLSVLLNDQAYKLQELKRATWNALHVAEEKEEYAVVKFRGKTWKRAFIYEGEIPKNYGRLFVERLKEMGIDTSKEKADWVGVNSYKTIEEAENAVYEYEKAKEE